MKNYFKNEIKNKNDELIVFNSLCSKVVDDKNVLGKLIFYKKIENINIDIMFCINII